MPFLTNDGKLMATKKENGDLKQRIDSDEIAYRIDGGKTYLFAVAQNNMAISDCFIPNDSSFKFPGVICIELDPEKPSQKFCIEQLKELEEGKVYRGFVSINDQLDMYKRAQNEDAVASILKGEIFKLTEQPEPQMLTADKLSPPKNANGGKRAYDPMQKFNTFKQITGMDMTLLEASLAITDLPERQGDVLIKLIEACL